MAQINVRTDKPVGDRAKADVVVSLAEQWPHISIILMHGINRWQKSALKWPPLLASSEDVLWATNNQPRDWDRELVACLTVTYGRGQCRVTNASSAHLISSNLNTQIGVSCLPYFYSYTICIVLNLFSGNRIGACRKGSQLMSLFNQARSGSTLQTQSRKQCVSSQSCFYNKTKRKLKAKIIVALSTKLEVTFTENCRAR